VGEHGAEAGEVAVGGGGQVGLLGGATLARVIPPCLTEVAQWALVSGGVSHLNPSGALHGLERTGVGAMLPQCGLPACLACT
ncbi:hypothetical protein J8J20_24950, partial [Mycobacterium tuberculosis]|nr:hypothetical protein [Mycobacterium tuberculosis]